MHRNTAAIILFALIGFAVPGSAGAALPSESPSFAYLVDYPKGEIATIKAALAALDARLTLTKKSNAHVQKDKPEIIVTFYPIPDYSKGGPDGSYTARVFLDSESLKAVRIELPDKK